MSFFGFDTSMPGETLDERLRRMAEQDENLEIYDFEASDGLLGNGGLGGGLEETLDEFNDDTFGAGPVGKDFDFSGSNQAFGAPPSTSSGGPSAIPPTAKKAAVKGAPSPFGFASFDAFADPLLGPVRPAQQQAFGNAQTSRQTLSSKEEASSRLPSSSQPVAPHRPTEGRVRTLEEIEAEMTARHMASRPVQQPVPGPQLPRNPAGPSLQQATIPDIRHKTLEEIEAEMMRDAQARLQSLTQTLQQAPAPRAADPLASLFPAMSFNQPPVITGSDPNLSESIEARIKEAEAQESARRRKAAKIHRMARYNGLMTQGDKDFITRIQVSQLVNSSGPGGTHDPYIEDFYFVVMQSLKQSRLAAIQQAVGGNGANQAGAPSALGPGYTPHQQNGSQRARNDQRQRPTRRDNAMNRMAQQVQRLVDDAKKKPRATQISLEGALGKIAIRTRSAPRPLLQVDGKRADSEVMSAAASSLSASLNQGTTTGNTGTHAALDRIQVLSALENVYDLVLQLEQSRRSQPALAAAAHNEQARFDQSVSGPGYTEARDAFAAHEQSYRQLADQMWKSLKVMEPLDVSSPHPFISLMSATKGKKVLPRVLRHTTPEQTLTILTLIVATFNTLDVVADAPILDTNPNDPAFLTGAFKTVNSRTRKQVEAETELFLNAAIPLVLSTVGRAALRIVTGMLGLLIDRNDPVRLAKTKPGLAFLTLFVSRGHHLKELTEEKARPEDPIPDSSELAQWSATFNHLVNRLSGRFPTLFPSTRSIPFGPGLYTSGLANTMQHETILDAEDEPVWHFLAALAVSSDMAQQQALVTEAREKVLENVMKARSAAKEAAGAAGDAVAAAKIRNVNVFLHSLGLDASQLAPE